MKRIKKTGKNGNPKKGILDPRNFSIPAEIAIDPYYELKGRMEKLTIKETQGHRKLKQYLEDLKRNKYFLIKIAKINKDLADDVASRKQDKIEGEITDISDDVSKLYEAIEKIRNSTPSITEQVIAELAEEYGIDGELFDAIGLQEILQNENLELGDIHDMAVISDNYDIHFNPVFPYTPFEMDTSRQHHYRAYPISIDLHKFTTKRDLIDFIEKRWEIIESYLETYRGNKKVRFRKRKYERKITDFIWENKELSLKQTKILLDKKYPGNGLAYYEIGKIISLEKRRRLRKITVGH